MRRLGFAIVFVMCPALTWGQPVTLTPLLDEPRLLTTAMSLVEEYDTDGLGESRDGFYPELGPLITGAGWITAGPGYRGHLWGRRALVDVSAGLSWRAYKIAQARLEFPHLANDHVLVACFAPLFHRVVIAVHAWGVFSDTVDGHTIPFYLLPSLGGHNTLRGYADYRFHDRHMVVGNVEARVPLLPHLDAAGFYDAGNVAARLEDLNFDRESFGGGLRLHTTKTTVARVDVARSTEGWRFVP